MIDCTEANGMRPLSLDVFHLHGNRLCLWLSSIPQQFKIHTRRPVQRVFDYDLAAQFSISFCRDRNPGASQRRKTRKAEGALMIFNFRKEENGTRIFFLTRSIGVG
jgi:hypothetical protein